MTDLQQATLQLIALVGALRDDYLDDEPFCFNQLQPDVSAVTQPARRRFVRTCFAYMDGTAFVMKQMLVHVAQPLGMTLSVDQQVFLTKTGPPFPPPAKNIRETLRIATTMLGETLATLGISDDQSIHDAFDQAARTRNRITHPKSLASYAVADSELIANYDSISWYRGALCSVIGAQRHRVHLPGTTDMDA